jgi:hypothetical protein
MLKHWKIARKAGKHVYCLFSLLFSEKEKERERLKPSSAVVMFLNDRLVADILTTIHFLYLEFFFFLN